MSIRLKIIFALVMTMITLLGGLGYLVINIYKEDKYAYIFTSSSLYLESLQKTFKERISKKEDILKSKLLGNPDFEKDGVYYYLELEEKIDLNITQEPTEGLNWQKLGANKYIIYCLKGDDNSKRCLVSKDEIFQDLDDSSSAFEFSIADQNLRTTLGQGVEGLKKEDFETDSGTKLIGNEGEEYLISWIKTSYGPYLLAKISQKTAFAPVEEMKKNILALLLISLGIGVLVSVILSNFLTKRLFFLMDAANEVARGDFTVSFSLGGKDEITRLGEVFGFMIQNIDKLFSDLETLNNELEDRVKLRTQELADLSKIQSTILDSLGQGLFIIQNDKTISPYVSKASLGLLGVPDLANQPSQKAFDSNEGELIEDALDQYFSGAFIFDDVRLLLPTRRKTTNKVLDYDYLPLENNENNNGVVVVVTDVTELLATEERFQIEKSRVDFLSKALKYPTQFKNFFFDLKRLLNSLAENLGQQDKKEEILRIAHTAKGHARIYSLFKIEKSLHAFEDSMKNGAELMELNQKLLDITEAYKDFYTEYGDILHLKDTKNQKLTVDEEIAQEILVALKDYNLIELMQRFEKDLYAKPLNEICSLWTEMVNEVAMTLNKKVKLEMNGFDIKVQSPQYTEFAEIAVHILRNAVDHGIESPDQRLDKGKTEIWHLVITASEAVEEEFSGIWFSIKDDGAGINIPRVRQKAIEKGIKAENLSDEEVCWLIFDSEFSSQDEVSLISGRGVGLDAVKNFVVAQEGILRLTTTQDQGTEFKIFLPFN